MDKIKQFLKEIPNSFYFLLLIITLFLIIFNSKPTKPQHSIQINQNQIDSFSKIVLELKDSIKNIKTTTIIINNNIIENKSCKK